jgi:hypothetical protein
LYADAGGRVGLGVCIDYQNPVFGHGEGSGQVNCSGCFTYTAFLIRHRDNLRHSYILVAAVIYEQR